MPVRMIRHAALGFSVHTGWAVEVAVAPRSPASAEVLDRRRIELLDGSDVEGPRFVYHAARSLSLDAARRLIARSLERSERAARAALQAAVDSLAADVVAAGIVIGDRPAPASLQAVLASHPAIHAAEGELFRSAVRSAAEALGIAVVEVRAKELQSRAGTIADQLDVIGRAAGRPWAKDHRQACLAAAVALQASGAGRR
jgi:hypothetical protein